MEVYNKELFKELMAASINEDCYVASRDKCLGIINQHGGFVGRVINVGSCWITTNQSLFHRGRTYKELRIDCHFSNFDIIKLIIRDHNRNTA